MKMAKEMAQWEKVLHYMEYYGGITSMDAFRFLGITRLSARIWELRRMGYEIESVPIHKNGVTFDKYVIKKDGEPTHNC